MTDEEVRKAFEEAVSDVPAVDANQVEDEIYVAEAERMKENLPDHIRELVDGAELITPSKIRENPIELMREFALAQMQIAELRQAYHAARHVLAAVFEQVGMPVPDKEQTFQIFVSDEAMENAPVCQDFDMDRDALLGGFTFTVGPCSNCGGEDHH